MRLPPRREPRVLAVELRGECLTFAVVDPWEVRSTGTVVEPRSVPHTVRRIVRREKPTVVVAPRALASALPRAVSGLGVPLVHAATRPIPIAIAAELFPEVRWYAPLPELKRVARAAISHVLRSPITHRRYAHRSRGPALHAR